MKHSPRHPEVRARLREPRRATARMSRRREQAATAGAVHPSRPAKTRAPQDDGLDVRTVVLSQTTRRGSDEEIGNEANRARSAVSPRSHCGLARTSHRPAVPDYPNRAVSFIVPFRAGRRHQPVRPRSGLEAGATPGQAVRGGEPAGRRRSSGGVRGRARTPDGYTLMVASSTLLSINVTVRKTMPYDPRKDLTPLALLARVPFVLVVNPCAAGPVGRRPRQARRGEAGPALLRRAGPAHLPSSQGRNVQAHVRARPHLHCRTRARCRRSTIWSAAISSSCSATSRRRWR